MAAVLSVDPSFTMIISSVILSTSDITVSSVFSLLYVGIITQYLIPAKPFNNISLIPRNTVQEYAKLKSSVGNRLVE
jgi:uncharacterized membrane-anchored protein YitT (DUF2179 family)